MSDIKSSKNILDIPVISITSESKYASFVKRLNLEVKNSRKLRMRVFNRKIKIIKLLKIATSGEDNKRI
jgi:hypothetical protein